MPVNEQSLDENLNELKQLNPATCCFIEGTFIHSTHQKTYELINPSDGSAICEVTHGQPQDINRAVASAKAAYHKGVWRNMPPAQKKKILYDFANLLDTHFKELAFLKSLEMGKPIRYSATLDKKMCLSPLRFAIESLDKLYGKVATTPPHSIATITREPLGVIGVITPWNFPIMMSIWKYAPALAMGNSVVHKPAEQTPLTALRIAELAYQAGIPKGVFNVVPGLGETTGKALAMHKDVDSIAFTGSVDVAKLLLQYAGQSNMKRITAETGGKTPNIIFADAYDIEYAAWQAAFGVFFNSGAMCVAGTRVLVQKTIHDKVVDILKKAADKMNIGHPFDPETRMGPIVNRAQFEKIQYYIALGKKEGATLVKGGNTVLKKTNGYYIEPTVFTNVKNDMRIAQDEIFGPVLCVIPFEDEQEAIHLANASPFGLAAALWTSDLGKAHRMAKTINAGSIWINNWEGHDQTVPFGGFKQSGFGGKDKAMEAFDKYSQWKTTWMHIDGKGAITKK